MDTTILHRAIEQHEIHNAVCRSRRQGLRCSTCFDLAERVERISRAVTQKAAA